MMWRRGRDSNPGYRLTRHNGFRDRRIQPLCHLSGFERQKMAERQGFEPWIRFWRIHDFQSCSFGQLGHLSVFSGCNQQRKSITENPRFRTIKHSRSSSASCSLLRKCVAGKERPLLSLRPWGAPFLVGASIGSAPLGHFLAMRSNFRMAQGAAT